MNVHRSIICNNQKVEQAKCPSTDEWLNNMSYSHKMECYSTIKKNEALIGAPVWMNLENIMLSERSHT